MRADYERTRERLMAWSDVTTLGVWVRPSPAESGVLAPSVAHAWVGRGTPDSTSALGEALAAEATTDLIIARYSSALTWVPPVLADTGRRIIVAGQLIYWGVDLQDWSGSGEPHAAEPLEVAGPDDQMACVAAIAEIFDGYVNHYSTNTALPAVDVGGAYADWTARAFHDPSCEIIFSRDQEGDLAGVALTREVDSVVDVLLAGVRPSARGKGVYSQMSASLVQRHKARGMRQLVRSTQDHNVAVQRLWIRIGLVPMEGVMITHLM